MKYFIIIGILIILFNRYIPIFFNTLKRCNVKHLYIGQVFSHEKKGINKLFNPSIQKTEFGYICCIRNSSITSKNFAGEIYGKISKFNNLVCLELNNLFQPISPFIELPNSLNLEDPRIIVYNNLYYILCTKNYNGKIKPIINVYNFDYRFIKTIQYKNISTGIHKNWCPIVIQNELFIHTDTYPEWRVSKISNFGNMNSIATYNSSNFFNIKNLYLRCSTSWKEYDNNTYICGLHTKTKDIFKNIRTLLVLIDKNTLYPIKKTDIFCINKYHERVQFLSGLEVTDNDVILTFGIGNYKFEIYKISKLYLNTLFK